MKRSFLLSFILLLPAISFAGTTGKIQGRIIEKDTNEPVIGANVILLGTTRGAATDTDGMFFILNVKPGVYEIQASAIGYTKVKMTNIRVQTDRTTKVDFELEATIIEGSEVVVVAARPILEKDRTNTAAYVNAEQIEKLPVQEVQDVLRLQTGVVLDAAGRLHLRGGRSGEVAYLIDGIPVTDQFGGGSTIEIENGWIQELQVISGTFNAEYGQAQSGVINVVTKEGSPKYQTRASVYTASYLSGRDNVFLNIDDYRLAEKNAELNFSGPLKFLPEGAFYLNGRFNTTDGWLFGQRLTRIEDTVPIQSYVHVAQQQQSDEQRLVGIRIPDSLQTGDGAFVPMNPRDKIALHGNLTFRPHRNVKVGYSLFYDDQEWKNYSDARRYSPDGQTTVQKRGYNNLLTLTHTVSSRTYYRIGFSLHAKTQESFLFEDGLDPRYQGVAYSTDGFIFGGTSNGRSKYSQTTSLAKFDLTSQVDRHNLIGIGAEMKYHKIENSSFTTVSDGPVYQAPKLRIPAPNTAGNNYYEQKPLEFSGYIQDKVELDEIILNAGIRFDYWDSRGYVPIDLQATTDPTNGIRLSSALKSASVHSQLSPRFGLAYPISDQGVIHVSYGHFFQIPQFSYMFTNSEFEIELGDLETIMGNADLKPEKTVAYEIGLQQALTDDWKLEATVYYKDIKNLLGQEIINTRDKKVYARYINRDYGNTRGFIVSLIKKFSNGFSGTLDYTYQSARGNASDPNSVFTDFQSRPPRESEKQVLPLDWDQTHTLNATVIVGKPGDWNLGVIGRLQTGQPYTPSNPGSALTTQFKNSERKPTQLIVDLDLSKNLKLSGRDFRLFVRVYNLLDRLNARSVFTSTGNARQPYRTLAETEILNRNPNFTLQEIDLRPDFYLEPRRMLAGLRVDF